jgi:hypothetical protein
MCTELLQVIWLHENLYSGELVTIVSDNEVLVMFVTPDGEGTAINISEWHKIK